MADIPNGVGEIIPDEITVTLIVDANRKIILVNAPGAKFDKEKPRGLGGRLAEAFANSNYAFDVRVQPGAISEVNFNELRKTRHSFAYMDVGRWGGPAALSSSSQRTFGIVCGFQAALCRFVPDSSRNTPADFMLDGQGKRRDLAINDLIDCLRSANSSIEIIKAIDSRTPLAPSSVDSQTVYVILPDLHLPIVTKKPPEAIFQVPGGVLSSPIDSPSFGRLDYRDLNSGQGGKFIPAYATAVRLWYDRYLKGDIFGSPTGPAAKDLKLFMNLLGACKLKDKIHFVDVGDMYDHWIGLDRFFDATTTDAVRIGDRSFKQLDGTSTTIRAGNFIDHWVERTNAEFPDLIASMAGVTVGKTSWIFGNHDNYLAAHTPNVLQPLQRIREIRTKGIFIEHGQRADAANRDGATDGHDITNQVFKNPFLRAFDPFRRPFFTTTPACSYAAAPDFCVYVMGHTHSPFLTHVNIVVKDFK